MICSLRKVINAQRDIDCLEELKHELQTIVGQRTGQNLVRRNSIIHKIGPCIRQDYCDDRMALALVIVCKDLFVNTITYTLIARLRFGSKANMFIATNSSGKWLETNFIHFDEDFTYSVVCMSDSRLPLYIHHCQYGANKILFPPYLKEFLTQMTRKDRILWHAQYLWP